MCTHEVWEDGKGIIAYVERQGFIDCPWRITLNTDFYLNNSAPSQIALHSYKTPQQSMALTFQAILAINLPPPNCRYHFQNSISTISHPFPITKIQSRHRIRQHNPHQTARRYAPKQCIPLILLSSGSNKYCESEGHEENRALLELGTVIKDFESDAGAPDQVHDTGVVGQECQGDGEGEDEVVHGGGFCGSFEWSIVLNEEPPGDGCSRNVACEGDSSQAAELAAERTTRPLSLDPERR